MEATCDRSSGCWPSAREPASGEAYPAMQAASLRPDPLPDVTEMVMAAARCWRAARDRGAPVQQRLHALLSPRGFDMLAPVLDSLLTLYETMLGRKVVTGPVGPSSDEYMLLNLLLDEPVAQMASIVGAKKRSEAFDSAIMSTRIMVGMAEIEERKRAAICPGCTI